MVGLSPLPPVQLVKLAGGPRDGRYLPMPADPPDRIPVAGHAGDTHLYETCVVPNSDGELTYTHVMRLPTPYSNDGTYSDDG